MEMEEGLSFWNDLITEYIPPVRAKNDRATLGLLSNKPFNQDTGEPNGSNTTFLPQTDNT